MSFLKSCKSPITSANNCFFFLQADLKNHSFPVEGNKQVATGLIAMVFNAAVNIISVIYLLTVQLFMFSLICFYHYFPQ